VVRVHLEGVGRTREDILVQHVRPIFDVAHFEELVLKSQDVRNTLKDLGCFSDVDVHIDTAAASTGGVADYEVTFRVAELARVAGSINTMIGNQEGSLFTGVRFPNLAGGGEKAQVSFPSATIEHYYSSFLIFFDIMTICLDRHQHYIFFDIMTMSVI
jgi:outer membrane protein insertion porin family